MEDSKKTFLLPFYMTHHPFKLCSPSLWRSAGFSPQPIRCRERLRWTVWVWKRERAAGSEEKREDGSVHTAVYEAPAVEKRSETFSSIFKSGQLSLLVATAVVAPQSAG